MLATGGFGGALAAILACTVPAQAQDTLYIGLSTPSVTVNEDVLDALGPPPSPTAFLPAPTVRPAAAPLAPPAPPAPVAVTSRPEPAAPPAPARAMPPPPTPSSAGVASSAGKVPIPPPATEAAARMASPDKPADPSPTPTPAPAAKAPAAVAQPPAPAAKAPPAAAPPSPAPAKEAESPPAEARQPAAAVEATPVSAPGSAAPVKPPPEITPPSLPAAPPAPAAKTAPVAATAAPPAPQIAALTPADETVSLSFAPNEATLSDEAKASLARVVTDLKADEASRLQLMAYASGDETSSSKARRVSLSRALAVRAYLIDQGVRSTRIDVRALGNQADGGTADRVDLVVAGR